MPALSYLCGTEKFQRVPSDLQSFPWPLCFLLCGSDTYKAPSCTTSSSRSPCPWDTLRPPALTGSAGGDASERLPGSSFKTLETVHSHHSDPQGTATTSPWMSRWELWARRVSTDGIKLRLMRGESCTTRAGPRPDDKNP